MNNPTPKILVTAELADRQSAALEYSAERTDLAIAFRSAARLHLHEAVANHFSLAVDEAGKRFLMNPNQRHFATICASDLLLLDADDEQVMERPGAPDPTAWGLHAMVHRLVPHALHQRRRPSSKFRGVGSRITVFEACSTFTARYGLLTR